LVLNADALHDLQDASCLITGSVGIIFHTRNQSPLRLIKSCQRWCFC